MSRTQLIREAEPPADVLLGTGRGGYRAGGKEGLHRKVRIGLETSEVTEGEAAPPSVWGLKEAAAPLGGRRHFNLRAADALVSDSTQTPLMLRNCPHPHLRLLY